MNFPVSSPDILICTPLLFPNTHACTTHTHTHTRIRFITPKLLTSPRHNRPFHTPSLHLLFSMPAEAFLLLHWAKCASPSSPIPMPVLPDAHALSILTTLPVSSSTSWCVALRSFFTTKLNSCVLPALASLAPVQGLTITSAQKCSWNELAHPWRWTRCTFPSTVPSPSHH